MNQLPAKQDHFEDAVESLILDWKGQDEIFYHQKGLMTIAWYVGRVKSLVESTEYKTNRRTKFIEAVCAGYGVKARRMYEAIDVVKRFSKPSDSVLDTSQRIFQEVGSWSAALPAKKEEQEPVEATCNHKCKIHCANDESLTNTTALQSAER